MTRVVILGGGAAGMAAAVFASEAGLSVDLYEQNEKLGKKLFITGKGRCNFTNVCTPEEFLENTVSNRKFLYSAINGFTPSDTMNFFRGLGLAVKEERGRRAFPESDHSSDVIRALERRMKKNGVKVHLNTKLSGWEELKSKADIDDNTPVILACGGLSYPSTGATGSGYAFARELGLGVTDMRPALVPLETAEAYIPKLQGLSLKNCTLTVKKGKKTLYTAFGEMLFTHFGISGPLALSASSYIGRELEKEPLPAEVDLKPALTGEMLDARLVREFEMNINRRFKNSLSALFPAKLVPVIVELSGIDPEKNVNAVSRKERESFGSLIKAFPFTLTALRPYTEAVITQGGIKVKEINPKTFEAKNRPNVYFIGEELDVDALTGGYNLQIAWSTAYAAVQGILEKEKKQHGISDSD